MLGRIDRKERLFVARPGIVLLVVLATIPAVGAEDRCNIRTDREIRTEC